MEKHDNYELKIDENGYYEDIQVLRKIYIFVKTHWKNVSNYTTDFQEGAIEKIVHSTMCLYIDLVSCNLPHFLQHSKKTRGMFFDSYFSIFLIQLFKNEHLLSFRKSHKFDFLIVLQTF